MRLLPWLVFAAALFGNDAASLGAAAEKLIQGERFADAAPLLETALRLDTNNAELRYRLGYTYFRLKRFAAARTQFQIVIRTAPPAHYSRYFMGRMALLEYRPAEAIRWLADVTVPDAASQLASAHAALGQTTKAMAALQNAISAAPWDSNLYYRLARLHQQAGQPELARESFDKSTRLKQANREDVAALMAVSQSLSNGKTDEALETGSLIKKRPEPDPEALVALGVLFGGAKMESEAIDAFTAATQRNSDHFQAQFNLGLALLRAGRAVDALAPLAHSVRLLPQSAEASLTYGLACVMNQRYGEAVAPLERVWNAGRNDSRAGSLLATALLRTGEPARAASVLKTVVTQPGAGLPSHMLLVEALNAAHDLAGALSAATAAAHAFPADVGAQMAAAQQLARVGRYQEAGPRFEQVLSILPGHPEAEFGLADCLQKAGLHDKAIAHYQNAISAPSTAAPARLGLARSLIALRRLEEGRTLLEEGVANAPNDAAIRLELSRVLARMGHTEQAAEQGRIAAELKKQ